MWRHHTGRIWLLALIALARTATAQELRSPLMDRGNSVIQENAASLMPTLRGRHLYADQGVRVGRVREVRVGQDGTTLLAIVARRRLLGGGEIGIPVSTLSQVGPVLTMRGTRDTIQAIPPL
ncbi:PRC-barrel domain containing protein [Methylobacterium fujisawaense]|uniref:PRC-barrel domain containing protein n=1 Tax=Methylobacterium fujisawaense TaxID=107400 RepID=UPI003CEE9A1A